MSSASARRGTRQAEVEREGKTSVPFWTRGTDEQGNLIDPTEAAVEVSFARQGDRPEAWTTAHWTEGGPFTDTPLGDAYEARLTIGGPGSGAELELAPGQWHAFLRVQLTADEVPVMPAGTLTVH